MDLYIYIYLYLCVCAQLICVRAPESFKMSPFISLSHKLITSNN